MPRRMLNEAAPRAGLYAPPAPTPLPKVTMGRDRRTLDPTHGFANIGEYARAVRQACVPGAGLLDPRLAPEAATPTTFGSEATGTDGGFAVPAQFSADVFSHSLSEGSLLPYVDAVQVQANSMGFPKDEATPWGTGGVRAYWQAEAAAGTQVKPFVGDTFLRLHKLLALVPVSDELLTDSVALADYLPRRAAMSITWKLNDALLFGDGAGQPLGMYTTSGPVVTVAKESGQATSTLTPSNLARMVGRLPPEAMSKALFLVNNDALVALLTGTAGNVVLGPPRDDVPQSVATYLGIPIVVSQHANTFSSQGDLLLFAGSFYRAIIKSFEPQAALSLGLWFDSDTAAFRFTFRVDGQPAIQNPLQPAKGATTMSPFLQLAAR